MSEARLAITGAGGFIGTALLALLAGRNVTLRALMGPHGAMVSPAPPGVHTIRGEIDDRRVLDELLDGMRTVIHLAGPPSVADSFRAPAEYARVHVVGTAALLDACRAAGVSRVVLLSSAEVYGQPDRVPVDEDQPLRARSPYGAAKIAAEKFVEAHARSCSCRAVILRLFSAYGPGQPAAALLSAIIGQGLRGGPVRLGDLAPVRDYCFVADAAEALHRACTVPLSEPVRVFNVGSGTGVAVAGLARLVLDLLGSDAEISTGWTRDRPGGADIRELVADPRRTVRDMGWRSRTPLPDGLEQTINWFRNREPS